MFGQCAICRQGELVAVRNPETGQLLVMCDDCESQWATPSEAESYEKALKEEVYGIVPASDEEIARARWTKPR
jgi:hypothetical protein